MSLLCKVNGEWTETTKFFKKENGSWIEVPYSSITGYIGGKSLSYGGNSCPDEIHGQYDPTSPQQPNIDVIYVDVSGKPNVKTNADGNVIEYTFTDTGGTGVTVSDVDTGIIAFDHDNPGFVLHLVAEFVPNDNNNKNIIEAYNATNRRGLYVYGTSSYCYKKIQTGDYATNSSFVAWPKFSPTGKDTNYYKTRNEITFDVVYTSNKLLSLHINNVEHFSNFSIDDTNFQNLTIKVGVGMTYFTIKEFSVTRT